MDIGMVFQSKKGTSNSTPHGLQIQGEPMEKLNEPVQLQMRKLTSIAEKRKHLIPTSDDFDTASMTTYLYKAELEDYTAKMNI
jgi:hypothetical protein